MLVRTHEYVNIAKMKTHIQAGVTLGIKNQKGLLRFPDKKRFHMTGLDACIRLLAETVQPDLTIVDGIIALEGDGPWRFGTRKDAHLLVAGTDMVEVDNVCLRLMGFPPEHAPHIPHRETVETVGLSIDEARTPFAYNYSGHFRYKNLYEHITDSCSGCNWTLYGALEGRQAVPTPPTQVPVPRRLAAAGHRHGTRHGRGAAGRARQGHLRGRLLPQIRRAARSADGPRLPARPRARGRAALSRPGLSRRTQARTTGDALMGGCP